MGFNSGFKGLTEFGYTLQVFIDAPNITFYGNPSRGSRADTSAQTDGHVEASRYVSRLFERTTQ